MYLFAYINFSGRYNVSLVGFMVSFYKETKDTEVIRKTPLGKKWHLQHHVGCKEGARLAS